MPAPRTKTPAHTKAPRRVIAVVNQKGGVGKTTTAVNLAASVAAAERKTLLLDMDPQGNASSGVGIRPRTVERSVYDCLIGRATLKEVIVPTDIPSLFVAPATQDHVAVELEVGQGADVPGLTLPHDRRPVARFGREVTVETAPRRGGARAGR